MLELGLYAKSCKVSPEPRNQAMPGVFQAAAPQRSARPNLAGVFWGGLVSQRSVFRSFGLPGFGGLGLLKFGAKPIHGLCGVGLVSPLCGVYKAWVFGHVLKIYAETKVPPKWSFGFPSGHVDDLPIEACEG